MDTNINQYDGKIKPIERIEFEIFSSYCSSCGIKPNSVLEKEPYGIESIKIPDLYDNQDSKRSGIIDSRLGMTMISPLDATYSISESIKILPN